MSIPVLLVPATAGSVEDFTCDGTSETQQKAQNCDGAVRDGTRANANEIVMLGGSGTIYVVQPLGLPFVKIGTTAEADPICRLSALRTACPLPLKCLLLCAGDRNAERRLHEIFKRDRLHGEWFAYSHAVESFVRFGNLHNRRLWSEPTRKAHRAKARLLRYDEIITSLDRKISDWVERHGEPVMGLLQKGDANAA